MRYISILFSLILIGCSAPPTKYDIWKAKQEERCQAVGGSIYLNGLEIECWRHPLARHAKMVFRSKLTEE